MLYFLLLLPLFRAKESGFFLDEVSDLNIRNSAKALVIHQGKLLVTKCYNHEEGVYYLLPGGGQEPGEKLLDTVVRECWEETGLRVIPHELRFLRECFLKKDVHRVEMIFTCSLTGSSVPDPAAQLNLDEEQVGIEWLSLDNLAAEPLFPQELRTLISSMSSFASSPVYIGEIF